MRVLLVETRELLDIGGDGRVGELLLELLVGLDDLFELVAHDGLLYMREGENRQN